MTETSQPVSPKPVLGKVGPALKVRRQSLRMSLAQVELETKLRGKFLTAFESGDYTSFPNDIYSRGFVSLYASHLGLDGNQVAQDYAQERGGTPVGETKAPRMARPKQLVFTGSLAVILGVVVTVGVVLWYLGGQFSSLAAPPQLVVTTPSADEALSGEVIQVSGHTTPGSDVSVDDSPVLTDTDGNFNEQVALQNGVNSISVTSKSKLGKVSVVTRHILATLPDVSQTHATVPAATFNGVGVAVSVKDTTSMVVTVDGKEAWRGTVLAGWSRTFTGATDVNLTTGNAGSTSVAITNSQVVNKTIAALGKPGEIRRNQDFAVGTVIP